MSRRRVEISVADVLAGRIRPDVEGFLRLIHLVNPTERDLPPALEARKYTEKSALQSLLIERFADQVTVTLHGGPGTVSLRLAGGRDAGHARLDALSQKARAWVQHVLDVAGLPDLVSEPPLGFGPEDGDLQPMRQGRAALARYDFDAAEGWFRAARDEDPSDVAPLLALLELWVEHLAADEKALALAEQAGAEPRLRGLLAVAAARSGRQREALRWLEGLEGPRAGEAWLWLGRAALQAQDLPATRRALEAIDRVQPGAAGLPGLRDEAAVLAARLRAPAEAALEASGTLDEIETRARRLIEAHPDSAVAARVLRAAAERRQAERLELLLSRAESEAQSGRFGAAASLYREALAQGAPVALALQAASARAEADRRQSRIDAVAERLVEPDEGAFLAWLALEASERAEVDGARAELVWLQQLDAPSAGIGAKEAVRAVRALAQARALMTEAPATALALVEAHRARLAGLPDAQRLLALADEAVYLSRAARQRALLDAASTLLRAGDRAAAQARLADVVPDALGEAELDRLVALRRQANLLDLLATARTAEERRPLLAELATLDSRFVSRLSALDEVIARAWSRRIFRDVADAPVALFTRGTRTDARIWLQRDGTAVLPDLHGPWLFLRWVTPGVDRVARAVRWRLPRSSHLLDFVVEEDRLRLLTEDREVIAFSDDGTTLLRLDALPGPRAIAGVLVPGTDRVWIVDADGIEVFGGATPLTRLDGVTTAPETLGAGDGARLLVRGLPPSGKNSMEVETLATSTPALFLHGSAGGRLRALGPAWGAVAGPGGAPVVVRVPEDGQEGLDPQGLVPGQAAGTRAGATFQLRLGHLWAGPLDWSLHVAPEAELLRDATDERVAVLVPDAQGLQVRLLHPDTAPPLTLTPVSPPGPELQPWRARFSTFPVERLPAVLATREALRTTPVATWLAKHRPSAGPWADALCHEALRRLAPDAAAAVLDAARRAWPDSGLVGLMEAEPAAESARWSRARTALEGREPEADVALRFHRILGFARLQTGAPAAALASWRAAVAIAPDEAEALEGLIATVAPALEEGPIATAPSVYAACMRALRSAEGHRLAGNLAGVIEALDHPWTWHFAEVQSLARLAEALLEQEGVNSMELLRKHHALALIAEVADGSLDLGPERRIVLPLAADRWSEARIEALAERARRWLEQH